MILGKILKPNTICSLILLLTFLFSCSQKRNNYKVIEKNGVTIVRNKSYPLDRDISIELKEVLTLNGETLFTHIADVEIDSYGNYYLLEVAKAKIHKFDREGNYIKTLGNQGQGPGEFYCAYDIIINNDTIYIPDSQQNKVVKYNLDGNFIGDKIYEGINRNPNFLKKVGNGFISSSFLSSRVPVSKIKTIKNISYYDENLDKVNDIYSVENFININDREFDQSQILMESNSKGLIYCYFSNIDKYRIELIDTNGNKRGVVEKNYKRIPFSEDQKIKNRSGKLFKNSSLYKFSLYGIYVDKSDYLWITPSMENNLNKYKVIDLFDQKGIFLNRVELKKIPKTYTIYLKRDKLIAYDFKEDMVKVFDYAVKHNLK
ncbi:MAG: hypothetical protein CR982_10340 [Candidatus Cloacimonadota bacterium]|nr:MAG: hypothetical protein CR982_10340 [Candidatus Cloacimonadota bacterium]PIE79103.1 MAG: hypothetical protein CSA15_04315 [Candidatus Delongbacteria bacterium]